MQFKKTKLVAQDHRGPEREKEEETCQDHTASKGHGWDSAQIPSVQLQSDPFQQSCSVWATGSRFWTLRNHVRKKTDRLDFLPRTSCPLNENRNFT